MTRHARNCTAGAVYTYHEKQKDTKKSGYGSQAVRFGKDSIKGFDCCCLTLQPCKNPVITQDGYLYDKEAIIEYILQKKREITRKLKEFERQKTKTEREAAELRAAEDEVNKQKFVAKESSILSSKPSVPTAGPSGKEDDTSISNMSGGRNKNLPSFWIPALTPNAKPTLIKKPSEKVCCPMSGKPIKLKDLFDIRFTPINDGDDKKAVIVKDARYVCAVTNDVLGNSVPCAALKTSGNVVSMECIEKVIRKDMIDPTNGKKLTEKDIIPLQRGATGFSASGIQLEGKKHGPSLMA